MALTIIYDLLSTSVSFSSSSGVLAKAVLASLGISVVDPRSQSARLYVFVIYEKEYVRTHGTNKCYNSITVKMLIVTIQ